MPESLGDSGASPRQSCSVIAQLCAAIEYEVSGKRIAGRRLMQPLTLGNGNEEMITSLGLSNARLFDGERWNFSLPPLSVICGTNSAGKSTLLKLPLLLRQSQGIGDSLISGGGRLRLSGSQVDLGNFESFITKNDLARDLKLRFTVSDLMDSALLSLIRVWSAKGVSVRSPVKQESRRVPYSVRVELSYGIRPSPAESTRYTAPRSRRLVKGSGSSSGAPTLPSDAQAVLKRAHFELVVEGRALCDWQIFLVPSHEKSMNVEPAYQIMIPKFLLAGQGWQDLLKKQHYESTVAGFENSKYRIYPVVVRGFLPDGMRIRVRRKGDSPRTRQAGRSFSVWPLPFPIGIVNDDIRSALTSVHYLGPLRTAAKRFYVAQGAVDPTMDSSGEFLPYVLRDQGESLVSYTPPGVSEPRKETLVNALDEWLSYLRTGEIESRKNQKGEIAIATTKEVLVEFSIRSALGRSTHALADSGFGYSQVLPILVKGLVAGEGSTLIVEQPELHLNPALQIRLAEFFVGLTLAGKQVILETHSEHMVNSVRVLAAERHTSGELCGVYFLDATDRGPEVHRMSIDTDGSVDNWPRNFFGDAAGLSGRLLRAQRAFLASDSLARPNSKTSRSE